jgi:RNA polymerase sigma-70 factor, ECF subfamily
MKHAVVIPLADFAALYHDHARAVHRFALFLSGQSAIADDLTSEAFVRVWTARERVDLVTVRGYLFAIVRNLHLQHVHRERRRVPLDEQIPARDAGPEERARDRSTMRAVLAALDTLPDVDRAAVLMRAGDGLPYEEIARALGISLSAAKVKVHRARLKLAETLESMGKTEARP